MPGPFGESAPQPKSLGLHHHHIFCTSEIPFVRSLPCWSVPLESCILGYHVEAIVLPGHIDQPRTFSQHSHYSTQFTRCMTMAVFETL